MERLQCYVCEEFPNGGIEGFVYHLKYAHGLTVNRGVGNSTFTSAKEGCKKKFTLFSSMRRHMQTFHAGDIHRGNLGNEDVENANNEVRAQVIREENLVDLGGDDENHEYPDPEIVNENEPAEINLRLSVVRMIRRLQANSAMTGSMLTEMMDECEELLLDVVNYFKRRIKTFVARRNIANDEDVQELVNSFEFDSPFAGLKTLNQQIDSLKEQCNYVDPIEMPLGKRRDQTLDRETGTHLPNEVFKTFQYVPIIDVLTSVLYNKDVMQAVLTERKSDGDTISGFMDGEHFKSHNFLQKFEHAIRLEAYCDDVEIVNPCGPNTGVHKLCVWYVRIQNLPAHMNSRYSSIHVLYICYTEDVKEYVFKKILKPFLNDLRRLKSEEGEVVNLGGEDFVLRATLVAFCGDGLAVHDIYGLLGPAANKCCRMCLKSRRQLLEGGIMPKQERTEAVFAEHLHLVRNAGANVAAVQIETGVRSECCLEDSRNFRVGRNKIFDGMHDILLGIGPMTLKLIINHFVFEERFFSVHYLNGRISAFSYGRLERKNKPSPNLNPNSIRNVNDHSLSQKAMQMWCFLRVFPFLVAEKVPKGHSQMQLLLLLLQIMEIVFALKVTTSLLPLLAELIKDFLELFKTLFPNANYMNKFHHLTHYQECILWSGSLRLLWCMGYERKHSHIKKRGQVVNNFKNCPKTLVRVCQCQQSAMWGFGDVKLHSVVLTEEGQSESKIHSVTTT